jgi:endonuclease-8
MPEGDTVWRTARRLHQALAAQVLTVSDLRWPSLATTHLSGAQTLEVVSRGKHILHRLDSGLTLHSHLRMDGQWRIVAAPSRVRPDDPAVRAVVGTEQWVAIGSHLGMLDVVATTQEDSLVGHLGPDVLGADWDLDRAVANVRRDAQIPIGAALLDQRNLAGVGTFYASEALFIQRLDPWAAVGSLGEAAVVRVVERARRLLDLNRRNAVQTTTGVNRRGQNAYVHSRSGQPCRRCGEGVRVAMIGVAPQDRTMFYCPRCQGSLAPTDDGRVQRPLGSSRQVR